MAHPINWHPTPSSLWQGVLGTLIVLGLLMAFHQVVLGAMQQGELHRKATAVKAEASWRCNTLGGPGEGEACLLRVTSPESRLRFESRPLAPAR